MSYANFSYTRHVTHPSGAAVSTTVEAGFGREGGRLEHVTRTITVPGAAAPHVAPVSRSPEVVAAAEGVRDALMAAGWVQDVVVIDGTSTAPASVAWTLRHGGTGSAAPGELPSAVQAVVDAASRLDAVAAATSTPELPPLAG